MHRSIVRPRRSTQMPSASSCLTICTAAMPAVPCTQAAVSCGTVPKWRLRPPWRCREGCRCASGRHICGLHPRVPLMQNMRAAHAGSSGHAGSVRPCSGGCSGTQLTPRHRSGSLRRHDCVNHARSRRSGCSRKPAVQSGHGQSQCCPPVVAAGRRSSCAQSLCCRLPDAEAHACLTGPSAHLRHQRGRCGQPAAPPRSSRSPSVPVPRSAA